MARRQEASPTAPSVQEAAARSAFLLRRRGDRIRNRQGAPSGLHLSLPASRRMRSCRPRALRRVRRRDRRFAHQLPRRRALSAHISPPNRARCAQEAHLATLIRNLMPSSNASHRYRREPLHARQLDVVAGPPPDDHDLRAGIGPAQRAEAAGAVYAWHRGCRPAADRPALPLTRAQHRAHRPRRLSPPSHAEVLIEELAQGLTDQCMV